MWWRLIIWLLPGTLGRAASAGTQAKIGTRKRRVALGPDDTSEVILIEGDALLSDKNDTEVMAL